MSLLATLLDTFIESSDFSAPISRVSSYIPTLTPNKYLDKDLQRITKLYLETLVARKTFAQGLIFVLVL